jgi:radical SAM superfamily enzyme YgiQ (UPF0313 family)
MMIPYEIGPIRPPSEVASLLIRVTRNCPWNRCVFCPVYKGEKFSMRPVEDVKNDITTAFEIHGDSYRKAFLQDANSICVKTDDLVEILEHLRTTFPGITRVTTYGRAKNIARRPVEELVRLKEAGLSRIHIGLESGSQKVLDMMNKGVSVEQQIEAGKRVKASGISLSEYIILGGGGKEYLEEHVVDTARVISAIDPDFIRVRTLRIVENTPLHEMEARGDFNRSSEVEVIRELRLMIQNFEEITSQFESDHSLNLLMEIRGKFPGAKGRILSIIDRFLSFSSEEQEIFILGRRMGALRCLNDLDMDSLLVREIKSVITKLRENGESPEDAAYQLMGRLI